jgi:hypothetical protein
MQATAQKGAPSAEIQSNVLSVLKPGSVMKLVQDVAHA